MGLLVCVCVCVCVCVHYPYKAILKEVTDQKLKFPYSQKPWICKYINRLVEIPHVQHVISNILFCKSRAK